MDSPIVPNGFTIIPNDAMIVPNALIWQLIYKMSDFAFPHKIIFFVVVDFEILTISLWWYSN